MQLLGYKRQAPGHHCPSCQHDLGTNLALVATQDLKDGLITTLIMTLQYEATVAFEWGRGTLHMEQPPLAQ